MQHPGDGWVECSCGQRHWGLNGAAGLLLVRRGQPQQILLQLRSAMSHHGGTWGLPGGARADGETWEQAALREAQEEAGINPEAVRILSTTLVDHGPWAYATVLAVDDGTSTPHATDRESDLIEWVAVDEVADRNLHPGFAASWDASRERLRAAFL